MQSPRETPTSEESRLDGEDEPLHFSTMKTARSEREASTFLRTITLKNRVICPGRTLLNMPSTRGGSTDVSRAARNCLTDSHLSPLSHAFCALTKYSGAHGKTERPGMTFCRHFASSDDCIMESSLDSLPSLHCHQQQHPSTRSRCERLRLQSTFSTTHSRLISLPDIGL